MSNSIIVYAPNGKGEKHTRANARDLVNGAGYSWHPNLKSTPASYAPFAAAVAPDGPPPSQRVLDSVGGQGGASKTAQAGANAAALEEQERIRAALAADAAAAPPVEPVDVVDYTQTGAGETDGADDLDVDLDAEPDEAEAEADETVTEGAEDAAPVRRGRRPREA